MIRPTGCKNTRTDNPQNVLVFLKGWGNASGSGSIYDYAANVDPSTNVRTPPFTATASISSNIALPGTPGDWAKTTNYCFRNITGRTNQAIYLSNAINISQTYDNTIMCRFYINAMPSGDSIIFTNGIPGGIGPYGGYGLYIQGGTSNLMAISGNYSTIGPVVTNLTTGTWYSVALTIDSSANWIVYLNGVQYSLGAYGIYGIVYGGLAFLGYFETSAGAALGYNGYITDCIYVGKALSSNICLNFSKGGSIF